MDRAINILEKNLLRILTALLFAVLLANYLLGIHAPQYSSLGLNKLLSGTIAKNLIDKEGVLTTIAAVLTGIYFTVFTLFGSLKLESTFAAISKINFFKLVKFLYHAFVGAFAYLLVTIVISFFTQHNDGHLSPPNVIVLIALLFYMLLSAFRFGLYCYLIFSKDLDNLHKHIKQEKASNNEQEMILNRLNLFLNDFEQKQAIQRAEEMKKHLENRKKN